MLLIGGAEHDSWVTAWRMRERAELFRQLGAQVSTLLYPGASHMVTADEISAARAIVRTAAEAA